MPLKSGALSLRFTRARGHGACGVEQRHALELCVSDEDLLVRRAAHLEPARRVTDRGERDEVVAFAAGKGDGESPAAVGARGPVDATGDGRRGDVGVLDRLLLGIGDLTTDDVELLRGDGARAGEDDERERDEQGETTSVRHGRARWKSVRSVSTCRVRHTR